MIAIKLKGFAELLVGCYPALIGEGLRMDDRLSLSLGELSYILEKYFVSATQRKEILILAVKTHFKNRDLPVIAPKRKR